MPLIAVTPYGAGGASARVRVLDWIEHLDLPCAVHDYLGATNASPMTLLTRAPAVLRAEQALRQLDVSTSTVLLHREASPLSSGDLETRLLQGALRSVYDIDDALQWDVRHGVRAIAPKHVKAERCARTADVVVAGSELLADWASRFSREVHLVPSCVQVQDYSPKVSYETSTHPIIGWVGSPSTEKYLRLLEKPLLDLYRRVGARLLVVSAGEASLGALDPMVVRVPWDPTTVGRVMNSFDVAIAPLVPDLFSRGKCAYKILQYGAAALPIVGSRVGANRLVLGKLGAASAVGVDEWGLQLSDILAAPASDRAAMGGQARSAVERHYSFAAWEGVMRRLLRDEPPTSGGRLPRA